MHRYNCFVLSAFAFALFGAGMAQARLTSTQLMTIKQSGPSTILGLAVPEPSTIGLVGGGLVLLGLLLKKR